MWDKNESKSLHELFVHKSYMSKIAILTQYLQLNYLLDYPLNTRAVSYKRNEILIPSQAILSL